MAEYQDQNFLRDVWKGMCEGTGLTCRPNSDMGEGGYGDYGDYGGYGGRNLLLPTN